MSKLDTNSAVNEILVSLTSGGFDPTPIELNLDAIAENTNNTVSELQGIASESTFQSAKLDEISTKSTFTNTKLDTIISNTSSTDTKLTTTNNTLNTIDGRVDGLETLVTSTNSKLDTLITNSNEAARGTVVTFASVTPVAALNDGSQQLIAAAATNARKGVLIHNNTNRLVHFLFGNGTANSTTSHSVEISADGLYEVMPAFANVAIQFCIQQGTATGTILVTTVN